jgi:mono/diheme cytochrome c family protein
MSQLSPRPAYIYLALALVFGLAGVEHLSARSVRPIANVPLSASHTARSIWDSVYSTAQAARGDSLYHVTCAKCHGDTLGGGRATTGEDSPSLVGEAFLANYYGLNVFDLYDKIQSGMPPDNPKTIDPKTVVDVMAFVFSKNKFPAGSAELPLEPEKLKDIKIEKSKSP